MIHSTNQTVIGGVNQKPYDLLVNPGLTRREKEVLALISLLDKEIASKLNISYRTVVNTSVKIRKKTGCYSKALLSEYAAKSTLIN